MNDKRLIALGVALVAFVGMLGLILGLYLESRQTDSGEPAGPVVLSEDDQPLQTAPTMTAFFIEADGWMANVEPVARYDIRGIVTGTREYDDIPNALFCPYDVGLAFGPMIREDYRAPLTFVSDDRRSIYRYQGRLEDLPCSKPTIDYNIANNHLLPADETVAQGITTIRTGDRVRLIGQLINIIAEKDGRTFRWFTSTVRTDTLDGACEVMYVTDVIVNDRIYSMARP